MIGTDIWHRYLFSPTKVIHKGQHLRPVLKAVEQVLGWGLLLTPALGSAALTTSLAGRVGGWRIGLQALGNQGIVALLEMGETFRWKRQWLPRGSRYLSFDVQ
jgi:hypothetical protein